MTLQPIRNCATGKRGGFTVIECLVFVAIWSSVCITSMWAIHEAGLMRSNAAMRAEMALVAQSELEHARAIPAASITEGAKVQTPADWWPENTSCTITMSPRSSKTWTVDVQVQRQTQRGLKPVRLTTIRSAG